MDFNFVNIVKHQYAHCIEHWYQLGTRYLALFFFLILTSHSNSIVFFVMKSEMIQRVLFFQDNFSLTDQQQNIYIL